MLKVESERFPRFFPRDRGTRPRTLFDQKPLDNFSTAYPQPWIPQDKAEVHRRNPKANIFRQVSSSEAHCLHCNLVLGTFDTPKNGLWLQKSNLSVCPTPEKGEWEVYPLEIFISARLLSILESSGARKVVAHSEDGSTTAQGGLLLWLFNPDIQYSSSRLAEPVVRAMKIFFREIEEPKMVLDEHQASVEDLQLDAASYKRLKEVLHGSNELLPPIARTFKEWTIGLLDRYEPKSKDETVH